MTATNNTRRKGPSVGARALAEIIYLHIEADSPVPSQRELADRLGVTKRTIARWVSELRQANMLDLRTEYIRTPKITGDDRVAMTRSGMMIAGSSGVIHPASIGPERANGRDSRVRALGGGGNPDQVGTPPPKAAGPVYTVPITEVGIWLSQAGVYPAVAARLESGRLAGVNLDLVQADMARLTEKGKGLGAIVRHWEAHGIPDAAALPEYNAGLNPQALRAQYGDMFAPAGDSLEAFPEDLANDLDAILADFAGGVQVLDPHGDLVLDEHTEDMLARKYAAGELADEQLVAELDYDRLPTDAPGEDNPHRGPQIAPADLGNDDDQADDQDDEGDDD